MAFSSLSQIGNITQTLETSQPFQVYCLRDDQVEEINKLVVNHNMATSKSEIANVRLLKPQSFGKRLVFLMDASYREGRLLEMPLWKSAFKILAASIITFPIIYKFHNFLHGKIIHFYQSNYSTKMSKMNKWTLKNGMISVMFFEKMAMTFPITLLIVSWKRNYQSFNALRIDHVSIEYFKQDITEEYANEIDKHGNLIDPITAVPIPKNSINTPRSLHIGKYVFHLFTSVQVLASRSSFMHPCENRDFTPEERSAVIHHMTRVFQISEGEFLGCWENFEATPEEKKHLYFENKEGFDQVALEMYPERIQEINNEAEELRSSITTMLTSILNLKLEDPTINAIQENINHTATTVVEALVTSKWNELDPLEDGDWMLYPHFHGQEISDIERYIIQQFFQIFQGLSSSPVYTLENEGECLFSCEYNERSLIMYFTFLFQVLQKYKDREETQHLKMLQGYVNQAGELVVLQVINPQVEKYKAENLMNVVFRLETFGEEVEGLERKKRVDKLLKLAPVPTISINLPDEIDSRAAAASA